MDYNYSYHTVDKNDTQEVSLSHSRYKYEHRNLTTYTLHSIQTGQVSLLV